MKEKKFFASLMSLKKGVGSGAETRVGSGSGSISQRVRIRGSGSAPKCHRSPTLLILIMGEAQLTGPDVAQIVVRRLAVRQAGVRISVPHAREAFC
jgi:hypothetical protein